MSEIEKKEDINTSNIFDEFEVDEETKNDINELEKAINKDTYYYLNKIGKAFKFLNYTLFIVIFVLYMYIFLQKSTADFLKNQQYLSPFCKILNGFESSDLNCSSLSISMKQIDNDTEKLEVSYLKNIISILQKTYEINNVKNSKESMFIIDKYKYKNDPYNIINEFDKIKNEFTSVDKKKIQCNNIVINEKIFEAKCSAFSSLWYENIPGLDGDSFNTIEGTSISLASSFINYLSKKQNITLLEKQKIFNISTYFGEGNYTYKTDFKIKFEYGNNDLSL